jgi:hypothetical protein
MSHRITFCIDSVLKHCAANRNRRLSELPNIGPYTVYTMLKFLALQEAPYIVYDISRLRVNVVWETSGKLRQLEGNMQLKTEIKYNYSNTYTVNCVYLYTSRAVNI